MLSIQVGPWVDLTPGYTYTDDDGSFLLGTTTNVTLSLNSVRDDGPTAERWFLDFDPSVIRVYGPDGIEILPGNSGWGHSETEIFGGQIQIPLTVKTIGPGDTALTATTQLWGYGDYPTFGWGLDTSSELVFNVAADTCGTVTNCGCSSDAPNGDLLHGNTTSQVIVGDLMIFLMAEPKTFVYNRAFESSA